MIVMPANHTGWATHALARETGRFGHLYSPGGQRGPWPWFPYAIDNGAFSCWTKKGNIFHDDKWAKMEPRFQRLLVWSQTVETRPLWVVVPDVPGNAERTYERWAHYAPTLAGFTCALAVQDGMTPADVQLLDPAPAVIAVGGTDDWKQATVASWARNFPRVHVLRCNSPTWLVELERLGVESCDGTGWFRGDRKQAAGLELWARSAPRPVSHPLWPHMFRGSRSPQQESFA